MDNSKTIKCTQCQKDTSPQECIKTSKGFVCKACEVKVKKHKSLYRTSGIIVVILLIVAGLFFFIQNKKNKAIGFEGTRNIQDSIAIDIQEPASRFKIETAMAQSSPIIAGQTIDNIQSFRRIFAENLENAIKKNENSIIIPTISIFFDFESANISSNANKLLDEYTKTYLQTNKQATILIQGYACNYGSNDVNNWISRERAESVKSTFISFGIPENKLEISRGRKNICCLFKGDILPNFVYRSS